MSLQVWVGLFVCAISFWEILANIIYFDYLHPKDNVVSIIAGLVSFVWFGGSVFLKHIIMRIGQVFLMAIVSVMTIALNREPLFIVLGVFSLLVTISVAFAYDFFDKAKVFIIILSVMILLLSFWVATNDLVTSCAITFGITVGCSIMIYPIWDKFRRLNSLTNRAMELAKRADPGESHG